MKQNRALQPNKKMSNVMIRYDFSEWDPRWPPNKSSIETKIDRGHFLSLPIFFRRFLSIPEPVAEK